MEKVALLPFFSVWELKNEPNEHDMKNEVLVTLRS